MIRLGLIAVLLGAAVATVAPAADLVNDTYVLRAGDTIAVTVWNHPEFSMTGVQIRPDGKFMHPYAGEILAAGKTPGRLAGELRQALLKELRSPVVSVDIVEYREDRVFVVGAVKNPGSYLMREPFTVQQALASAGGATPTADMSSALLISPAGERTTVNLAAEMSVDPAAPRTPVTGGSTLILYERREERVAVLGAVQTPGMFQIPEQGLRLHDALALAGGYLPSADPSQAKFTRAGSDTTVVDLRRIAEDINDPANLSLVDGDAILVPVAVPLTVAVLGQVNEPGVKTLNRDKVTRLSDAVGMAGGVTAVGDPSAASLLRADGTILKVALDRVLSGQQGAADLALASGDTLFIPDLPDYTVLGTVQAPGRHTLMPGTRISTAIAASGGLSGDPRRAEASIIRQDGSVIPVDLRGVLDERKADADIALAPGDILLVRTLDRGQVAVLGAVRAPGRYPLGEARKLVDLIAIAGLTSETSNVADLMRDDGTLVSIDLDAVLIDRKPELNIPLRDGDTLVVRSAALNVSVLGAVTQPNRYAMRRGNRFADALAAAGGLTANADRSRAKVIRMRGETLVVDPSLAMSGDAPGANPVLEDGDIIVIDTAQIRVAVLGEVTQPAHAGLRPGARVSDALATAGGLAPGSRAQSAKLMRADGSVENVDLRAILRDANAAANITLREGDTILVETADLQVAVLGEVAVPGHRRLLAGSRVSDALAASGGLAAGSRAQSVSVLRPDGSTVEVPLADAMSAPDSVRNLVLLDGDTLFVETKTVGVTLLGELARPGYLELPPGSKLSDALAAAGGTKSEKPLKPAKLVRRSGETAEVDLAAVLDRLDPDANLVLLDGDTVIVSAEERADVAVLGQVTTPSKVRVFAGSRVSDVIAGAGGLAASADAATATLMRDDGTVVTVDLDGIFVRNDPAANITVRGGDTLVVGTSLRGFAAVVGAVRNPGLYPVHTGDRLSDLYAKAGGVTSDSEPERAVLRRADGTQSEVDLLELVSGAGENLALAKGDVLFVPTRTHGDVAILGAVTMPGRYPVGRGERFSAAVARAAGLSVPGVGTATLMRADGALTTIDVPAAMARPGSDADPVILSGDTIVVNALDPVTVVGAVQQPGTYALSGEGRVSWVLARALGVKDVAALDKASITSKDGTRRQVDLRPVLQGEAGAVDPELKPGDTLVVPAADYRVSVVGHLNRPGRFPFQPGARVLDAIALAEGISETARADKATVLRDGQSIEVDLAQIQSDRSDEQNLLLQDGDTVVVGSLQLPEVAVLGQVAREGHYTLRSGAKLSQAIAQAGGFTSMADTDHVKLVRNGEQQFVDLSMIERGAELPADPQLQDGDLIIVPESMHRVTILGLVKNPGNYMFKKGDRVVDVLGEAGGWIERQGAPNRAILVRKLPDGRLGAGEISPLRTAVRGDQKGNPLLEDGDIIYIPQVSRMTFTGILNTLFQGSSFVRLILE